MIEVYIQKTEKVSETNLDEVYETSGIRELCESGETELLIDVVVL